ncbi:hypothetical protein [Ferrimonas marina]|uniref:Uncharacterized protein n=1 Tax=Ferrimonas marina TaxID=299255 RepID=A0A1M5TP28_9GAMM|nr:hypothetical protein [Ferrimonas marina]SHH52440.1 hypothetical protein SAMN02745129_2221 [Ferrimonas marina]
MSKAPCQDAANELATAHGLTGGETVKVSIQLAAQSRHTYEEVIEVPAALANNPSAMEDLVRDCYDQVDGTDFEMDNEYWQKSELCNYSALESGQAGG